MNSIQDWLQSEIYKWFIDNPDDAKDMYNNKDIQKLKALIQAILLDAPFNTYDTDIPKNYQPFVDILKTVLKKLIEDEDDIKCYYCNSRGVDTKKDNIWIHADCE